MRITRSLLSPVLLAAAIFVAVLAAGASVGDFLRVRDGRGVSFEQVLREIDGSNLVFVGENHGNTKHHDALVRIVDALRKDGRQVVIGLEMFRANSQDHLRRWVSGEMGLDEFLAVYRDNWDFAWPAYSGLFMYARQAGVPMIGLNVPREITRKVASNGFASLTEEELRQLPEGLTCDVDEEYMEFIRKVYSSHDTGKAFVYFCEAQMVWDKVMAHYLMEFLGRHPDVVMVVLTGANHSWKRAIPEQVRRQSDYKFKVIIPERTDIPPDLLSTRDADFMMR